MKNLYIKLFLLVTLFFGLSVVYAANELKFEANLSGAQEVTSPAGGVATDTAGTIEVEFDAALTRAQFRLAVRSGAGITQALSLCICRCERANSGFSLRSGRSASGCGRGIS